ncbi:MAG: phosphate regulon sensor histidine kinase PhoR [Gammaproteobacteria bacterium]
MPSAWIDALLKAGGMIGLGLVIGWLYGSATFGGFVGAVAVIAVHFNSLFRLERELRTRSRITVPEGTGIWPQVLARINYLKQRAKKHKRRHHRTLKEIRASTNAMPDGGIVLDQDSEITRYNSAAERLIGLRPRRDKGQRIDNLIRHPAFVSYLRSGDYSAAVTIPSPLREDEWLACRIVPYGEGQRLLLVRDITEQTRLARMRRDFVANASHELRSPLTVIGGYLEAMVDDSEVPEDWQRPIAEMQRQAARMKEILDSLLELSRLESGSAAASETRVDVGGVLRDAVREAAVRDSGPTVELQLDSRAQLFGNPAEIRSIVTNLLSNALRYTPAEGRVTLGWRSGPDGAELTVEDTGVGIAEQDIPRLTERFFRVNRGRSRDDGGVGLGLAIVKHALARHDGTLEVESRLGSGSRFVCHFPVSRLVRADTVHLSGERRSGHSVAG